MLPRTCCFPYFWVEWGAKDYTKLLQPWQPTRRHSRCSDHLPSVQKNSHDQLPRCWPRIPQRRDGVQGVWIVFGPLQERGQHLPKNRISNASSSWLIFYVLTNQFVPNTSNQMQRSLYAPAAIVKQWAHHISQHGLQPYGKSWDLTLPHMAAL